ncbi:hypothetical protein ACFL0T_08715, partial [Candidatus Omnitrophota bacterium]
KYLGENDPTGWDVNIYYTFDDGEPQLITTTAPIAHDTGKDGSDICHYEWAGPDTAGTKYKVKIEQDHVTDKSYVYAQSNSFFVMKGDVTLVDPGMSEAQIWFVDETNTISWGVTGGVTKVDIFIDLDGSLNYATEIESNVDASPPNYSWYMAPAEEATREAMTSETCRIRVYDHGDNTVYTDPPTYVFKMKPRITFGTDPNNETAWVVEQTECPIKWTTTGDISAINIYSSPDGEETWYQQDSNVSAGALTYPWTIPTTDTVSHGSAVIQLRRSESGVEDDEVTDESPWFTIRGKIGIDFPTSSKDYNVEATGNIEWSTKGTVGTVDVRWSNEDPTFSSGSFSIISGAQGIDSGLGIYTFTVPSTTAPSVALRVVEEAHTSVYGQTGAQVAFLGNIIFDQPSEESPSTSNQTFTVGSQKLIQWSNKGSFTTLRAYFIKDEGTKQQIGGDLGDVESVYWTPGDDDISTDIRIRVEDALNENNVFKETPNDAEPPEENEVIGSMLLEDPSDGNEVYTVGSEVYIQWLKQGNLGSLKAELRITETGYPSTGWLTNSGDTGLSDTTPQGDSGSTQTYTWTVPDKISTECRIRLTSNTYPSDSWATDDSGSPFTIKGAITSFQNIDEDTVWKVGNDQIITWNQTGTMSDVKIEIDDGLGWDPIENAYDNGGQGLAGGSNTYTWVYTGSDLQNVKSDEVRIKVTSNETTGASLISDTFTFIPNIIVTTPAASWVAETKPTVTWTYTGVDLGNVKIVMDRDWTGTWEDEVVLESNVNKDESMPYTLTSNLAANRSDPTHIRVVDKDFPYAYGESGSFKVIGELTLDAPAALAEWEVGDSQTAVVDWSYKGDLDDVKIYYSTDGSDPTNLIATVPASDSKWTWSGSGVVDDVTSTAKIKVEAEDADTDTYIVSDTFLIVGNLTFTNVTGQCINIDKDNLHEMIVKWTATGNDITKVKFDYSYDGQEVNFSEIAVDIDNTYKDGEQENQWTWLAAGIPQDQSTVLAKLRISAYTPLQPESVDISAGAFSILGDIYIDEPDGGVEDVWISDGVT